MSEMSRARMCRPPWGTAAHLQGLCAPRTQPQTTRISDRLDAAYPMAGGLFDQSSGRPVGGSCQGGERLVPVGGEGGHWTQQAFCIGMPGVEEHLVAGGGLEQHAP